MTLFEKAGQMTQLGPSIVGGFDFTNFMENPDPEMFQNIQRDFHEDWIRKGEVGSFFWFTSKYIDGPVEPLYPFGFGLSYTTFAYSDLVITPSAERVVVNATVKNTGDRAGEEVVQCYIGDVVASRVRPVKALKGFQKVALSPSEQHTVTFELPVAELGFYNVDMQYVVEPGKFKVWVGPSSVEGLEGEFEL